MLNKVSAFIRQYELIEPGARIVCALSGGADSVALLFALYLLKDKLEIELSAAHFNHGLRGEEADRDQAFAENLCHRLDIPIYVGSGKVTAGEKGLEAAARQARYAYFETLPGKIATAHTADDNAETVLMHLIRGTGLKGLGGISPIRGNIIRPMLTVTRQEVLAFLQEYNLSWVEDSSNQTDAFLRNRLRHRVIPVLKEENPKFAENLSQTALLLRQDEQILSGLVTDQLPDVAQLRQMSSPLRRRQLRAFLESAGVKEPETEHIMLAQALVFSDKPSASGQFPGGITLCRNYDRLTVQKAAKGIQIQELPCPGTVEIPEAGIRIYCEKAEASKLTWDQFTVYPQGQMVIRSRMPGDEIRLNGGTKSLKALFIGRKIPAGERQQIPVIADSQGVLAVWGIGANLDRTAGTGVPVMIRFEKY